MTEIHLIRHGKASPRGADYDILSEKGWRQAQATGRHLAACGVCYAAVYVGPLRRQQDTWQAILDGAGTAAQAWPASGQLDGLAEAPMVQLLRQVLPQRLTQDGELQRLVLQLEGVSEHQERRARYSAVYQYLVGMWVEGTLEADDLETYDAFRTRVAQAWRRIQAAAMAPGDGHRVAVVSSMGAIAELLKQALGWDARHMLERSEQIANASITTLRVTPDGYALAELNHTSHLEPEGLVTYI